MVFICRDVPPEYITRLNVNLIIWGSAVGVYIDDNIRHTCMIVVPMSYFVTYKCLLMSNWLRECVNGVPCLVHTYHIKHKKWAPGRLLYMVASRFNFSGSAPDEFDFILRTFIILIKLRCIKKQVLSST